MPLDERAPCTVCIPTYNQAQYLRAAVESVAAQTVPVRLIVADDASPDNTAEVLEGLQARHSFEVVRHPTNVGISANLQILLRAAETPLLVRLDSDDLLYPGYVEELMSLMGRYPQAGYAHCAIQEVDEAGHALQQRRLGRMGEYQDADTALRRSLHGYQVAANVLMFRREALAAVDFGAGSPELNFVEDYDLSIRLADAGWGNVYTGEVLASYRTWSATSRPVVGRKLREVRGVKHIFSDSLEPAFRKRQWSDRPLRRRRRQLALANAEILDRGTFQPAERAAMVEALAALGGSRVTRLALGTGFGAHLLRRSIQWSAGWQQAAKLLIKRIVFRRR